MPKYNDFDLDLQEITVVSGRDSRQDERGIDGSDGKTNAHICSYLISLTCYAACRA